MAAARHSLSGVPLQDLVSSRSPGNNHNLAHNGRNDNDDDDPWQLPHLMPPDSEQQPLQAPSYASRRSTSQRKKPASVGEDEQPPWATGVWARMPYSGIAALIGVLLLTGASIGVVIASHNVPIEEWHIGRIEVQPQVWVSAFSTIANALLGYAFAEGLAISFWRRAIRGTTLRALHDSYEAFSILPALHLLFRGRFNTVALACVAVTLCMARGPLFQRATTVSTLERELTGVTTLNVAQEIPLEYFNEDQHGWYPNKFPNDLRAIIQNAGERAPVRLNYTGCAGECDTTVKGSGFRVSCTEQTRPFTVDDADMGRIVRGWGCAQHFGYDSGPRDRNVTACSRRHNERLANVQVFGVGFAQGPPALQRLGDVVGAGINLTTVTKPAQGCRGTIRRRTCALRQATVEYDVRLTNNSIALRGAAGSPSNASRSADNATTSTTTTTTSSSTSSAGDGGASAPPWQPRQDRFVADTPPDVVGMTSWWTRLFPLLVPPMQVNLTHSTMATSMQFKRYLDCRDGSEASNTSCSLSNPVLLRDLALECVVEPYNLSAFPGATLRTGQTAPAAAKERKEAECAIHWRDPMQDLIDSMRELAFRMSLHAADASARNRTALLAPHFGPWLYSTTPPAVNATPGADANAAAAAALRAAAAAWTQRVPFLGRQRATVYRADWAFLAVAAGVGAAGVLAVLPLYAGWWALGRAPSLNPLETGVAMGAPLLLTAGHAAGGADGRGGGGGGVNSNASRERIVERLGARRVRYGAVPVGGDDDGGDREDDDRDEMDGYGPGGEGQGGGHLARRHQQQQHVYTGVGGGEGRMRLRLVDVERARQRGVTVTTPRKGDTFV